MTEEEWLTGNDPGSMLKILEGKASERKLRLYAVGCWRVVLPFYGRWSREAVEIAESFADGNGTREDLLRAWQQTRNLPRTVARYVAFYAARSINGYSDQCAAQAHRSGAIPHVNFPIDTTFLRDIFGNPFRPVAADPAWLTPTAVSLAAAIYEDRAFDRLPVLADALEEAGCTNAAVLLHCRQPSEHVRGCWVVDLVLGKA